MPFSLQPHLAAAALHSSQISASDFESESYRPVTNEERPVALSALQQTHGALPPMDDGRLSGLFRTESNTWFYFTQAGPLEAPCIP